MQDAFLMPASQTGDRRSSTDYRPSIKKAQGHVPACLVNASVTYCSNDCIYAFGGFDQFTDEVYNHVLRLDLETLRWELVDNYGDIPGVRMGHTATLYQGDKLIVFGGENEHREYLSDVVILDLNTFTWALPEIRGSTPRGRARHAAVIHEDKLFIVGGVAGVGGVTGEKNVILDDLTYLDLQTWTWSRTWSFTARFDHTAWVWGTRLWIFGGLGPNMERTTDIWWLDLKGSPSLAGNTTPKDSISSSTHQISPRSGIYAANSGSVQVLIFTHFPLIFRPGYRWHYCTVNDAGTKAWLLGCSLDIANAPGGSDENHMSEVLTIDLENYGLLGNGLSAESHERGAHWSSDQIGFSQVSGLGTDLAAVFDNPAESGSGTDFVITAIRDEYDGYASEDMGDTLSVSPTQAQPTFVEQNPWTSKPIHVHRIILQLRWPHFKRLYSAHMAEYHTKRMHIPESYSVVRAFLYYLYTDSIAGHPDYCSTVIDVAGMLVMANLYDMPKLRLLCVNRLGQELDVDNAAIVWERAGRTNEHWLMRRAAQFCMTYWGRVVRTDGFKSLSHKSLIQLCEMVDTEGRILAGPELEMVTFGADGLVDRDKSSRMRLGSTADEMSEVDADDEGMEIS
ncbi:Kelch repeat protein [Penicillium digitatum]|uniref:Kelch repeat protein n=1 Tax=Penicillium digitatum TaxID=36651 RepID=A0A7T6XIX1_PENDI|nr:Kelch repeat protein [Penicillium digitatum]